jgi:SH3-like domain-containing protein
MVSRGVRLAAIAAAVWTLGASGAAAQWCVRGVAGWDTLRIRTAPSPQAREIGAIAPNACGVAIVGRCRGAWCPVAWRGQRGWSNTVYLGRGGGFLDMLMVPPWAAPARGFGGTGYVAAPRARVRARTAPRSARVASPRRPATSRISTAEPPLPPAPPPAAREVQIQPQSPPPRVAAPAPPVPPPPATTPDPPASRPETAPAEPIPRAGAPVLLAPPTAAPGEVCIVGIAKGDTLKVRAGPGPDQTLRFGFPPGVCGVRITGPCKDGWCPVEYRIYRGWAEQQHLK